jgi:hypothetical protein
MRLPSQLWGTAAQQWRAEEAVSKFFGHFQAHLGVGEKKVLEHVSCVLQGLSNACVYITKFHGPNF